MDRKRQRLAPEKVIAELEQVKEELGRSELESEIDKYKEQCTELQSEKEKLQSENEKLQSENRKLQSENKRLQKYLQDLESGSVNVREKRPINLCHSDATSQITKLRIMNNRYPETPGMNPPPGIPRDYPYGPTPMPTSNPLYPSGVGFAPNMSASPYPSTAFTSGNPSNSPCPAASSSYLLAPASFSNRYPASTSHCPASSNSPHPASTSSIPISSNSCYPTSCNSTRPAQTLAYLYRSNRHYPASVSSYPVPPLMNQHPGASPYPLMGSRGCDNKFGHSVNESSNDALDINESSNDALDINSLPDEILVKVFGYLKQNKLGQIARVCRRWNVLTKSGVLWRKVNVAIFFPSDRSENINVKSFINGLPSCVTFIRLFFYEYGKWMAPLDFEELCLRLQEKCPHLEELILNTSQLSNSLSSVIDLCTKYLQNVKNLIFQYVKFRCARPTGECFGISKIEKLELYYCTFDYSNKPLFTKMPYLKHLHVCGDDVGDSWIGDDGSFLNQLHVLHQTCSEINSKTFSTIQDKGLNLRELYCCGLSLHQGHDLTFTNSAFPHLEAICISHTGVTCESVVSLVQSHPSLQNVYVDEDVAESFAAHPFVLANRCKAGIVKAIKWGHDHKVDYPATRF